jgi:hypothetical protein
MAITLTVTVISAVLVLPGCIVRNGTTVNWSSSVTAHRYAAHYASFNGNTSVPIDIQESQVVFAYQAAVDKGSLAIKLSDPGGKDVWHTTLTRSGAGTRTVPLSRSGRYNLSVDGQDTGGNFDIQWR